MIPREEWLDRFASRFAELVEDEAEDLPDSGALFWKIQMEVYPDDPEACAEDVACDFEEDPL